MSRPPLRKPTTPVRRPPPAAFRCPACDEALRVRGDRVGGAGSGQAFDCPSCGAGLLLSRDDGGEVAVRTVGGAVARPTPRWPFALAAVGVGCALTAGWLVLRSGPERPESNDRTEIAVAQPRPPDEDAIVGPPSVAAEGPPVEPEPVVPQPTVPDPVTPEPIVPETVEPEPIDPPKPVRPAVTAPRPSEDLAVRRIERRLDATLSSYRMSAPRPLREIVADFEDLLRVRITVEGTNDPPVQLNVAEPTTVREALEALADAAGRRVRTETDGVRLVPSASTGSPSPTGGAPP
ncbi:hypothetical protein [Alienimonas chondri]|uniref:Uncharacterized protein n=1 Tax=Alienimonas chondri TaxID=2681879 RepID=A0ABX1VCG2_9PLAN|nr:hypothetical protein [Alienimonas chondri]NNJ25739.1 hypothetical protein [Alienimonas chondri]